MPQTRKSRAGGAPAAFAAKAAAFRDEEALVARAQSAALLSLSAHASGADLGRETLDAARLAAVLDPASWVAANDSAVLALQAGDLTAAIVAFRAALWIRPQNATIRANFAGALLAVSAHAEAADELERVVALDPAASGAHVLLVLCLLESGRTGDADAAFERACRVDPHLRKILDPERKAWAAADSPGRGRILSNALSEVVRRSNGSPVAGANQVTFAQPSAHPIEPRAWTQAEAMAARSSEGRHSNGRIGFALHSAELLNHYCHIWRQLEPGTFELIAAAPNAIENTRITAFGNALGYPVRFVGDLLADGESYELLVSNHFGAAGVTPDGKAVVPSLGRRHLRMMYALGKAGWNFADWNDAYETILCWGPYQAGGLAKYANPRLAQVGYPRFDSLFWPMEERADSVRFFGGDPARPTVVWLPTWGDLSSIDAWAESVGKLRSDFNLIVKVHPLTGSQEPARMKRLEAAGIEAVADPILNNVRLFRAADFVLADYGGSPFGALYADRDLILLNVPGAAGNPLTGAESIDLTIRQWLFSVNPEEPELLPAYLTSPSLRQDQHEIRERLRRAIFAPFEGVASDVAASAIAASLSDTRHAASDPGDLPRVEPTPAPEPSGRRV
jgi:tetratricopeptide (TPR) repeat protein